METLLKKLSNSQRRFIRGEKASIRRQIFDIDKQTEAIAKAYRQIRGEEQVEKPKPIAKKEKPAKQDKKQKPVGAVKKGKQAKKEKTVNKAKSANQAKETKKEESTAQPKNNQ